MVYRPRRSRVFIVRTWTEEHGEQLREIRGMVRDVHSGETRYFRTWKELLKFVATHAKDADPQEAVNLYAPAPSAEPERSFAPQEELPGDVFDGNPDPTPDGRD